MNVALMLALVTSTLSLATAIAHLAVSRAPGWRASRTFAFLALTACGYCVTNVVYCVRDLPMPVYLVAIRWNYLCAHLHGLAWIPMAFGGPEASLRAVSRPLRAGMFASLAIGVLFALTGWQVTPPVTEINVAWAGVTYHYLQSTPAGELYGALLVLTLAVPFGRYVRGTFAGDRSMLPVALGFTGFFACAVVEWMTANRIIAFIATADIGFLMVVVPTSVGMLRRFTADARRLSVLSGELAGQVASQTAELARAHEALAESERLAALGRLSAGVGHEINNPLTYVQFSLEQIDEHLRATHAPAEFRDALAHAQEGTRRIRKVAEGLRTYSRPSQARAPVAPTELVAAALRVAGPQLRHHASVATELADVPPVLGDEPRLVQALVNLLSNAAQALAERPGGGRIVVRSRTEGAGAVVLEVEDDGPGIPEANRAHVAEPYFTTRAQQGGLGLGLFVTRGIVDGHEGRLELLPAPHGGTCARMTLPAASARDAEAAAAEAPRHPEANRAVPAAPARGRLLVVDDEPLVLELLGQFLARDWEVTRAESGAIALERLSHDVYDGIVCDLMMPGLSGMALAEELATRDPAARARMVFLTGGAVTQEAQAFIERPDVRYVMKPVDLTELNAALRTLPAAVATP